MPKQTREALVEHLMEQLRFLTGSCRAYDEGDKSEAKRIAATLRVLLHHTKRSHSLLNQLHVQHRMMFLDTSAQDDQQPGVITFRPGGLATVTMSWNPEQAEFRPNLDGFGGIPIRGGRPFRQWWHQVVLRDHQTPMDRHRSVAFTRDELVLFLANKAGGAHVDPQIAPHFHALTVMNSVGWGWRMEEAEDGQVAIGFIMPAGPSDQPMGNPIPANVRQIAYEALASIAIQLDDQARLVK